jgi:hypothetical protein
MDTNRIVARFNKNSKQFDITPDMEAVRKELVTVTHTGINKALTLQGNGGGQLDEVRYHVAGLGRIGYTAKEGKVSPKTKREESKSKGPDGDKILAYVSKGQRISKDQYNAIVEQLKTLVK